MTQTGFRLTFPGGATFVAKSDIEVSHQTETQWLFSGFDTTTAAFQNWFDSGGKSGRASSKMSTVREGIGAGVHRISIRFVQFEGSDESWGDADPEDSARTKLETLNRAITEDSPTSSNPATYQGGEYSASGKYAPIDVVIETADLPYDVGENASSFSGTLTLLDAVDLRENVDAQNRPDR